MDLDGDGLLPAVGVRNVGVLRVGVEEVDLLHQRICLRAPHVLPE